MWGRGKEHTSQRECAHRDWGGAGAAHSATQKQPYLTGEIITATRCWSVWWPQGLGMGKQESRGTRKKDLSQDTVSFLSPPLLSPHRCTPQKPWPSISPFLPPSAQLPRPCY